jgi:FkbM family methyltransferase
MIFLDLGTNEFQGLEEFTNLLGLGKNTIVHCYEPNTLVYDRSKPKYVQIVGNYRSLTHNNAAIMDYTGKIQFNSHHGAWQDGVFKPEYTGGSNCLELNPESDECSNAKFDIHQEMVDCKDILDVLHDLVAENGEDCKVIIKCDIEGSEFKVLPRMMTSPYVKNITQIHIEWHERFYEKTAEYDHICELKQTILQDLAKHGITYYEHH